MIGAFEMVSGNLESQLKKIGDNTKMERGSAWNCKIAYKCSGDLMRGSTEKCRLFENNHQFLDITQKYGILHIVGKFMS